MLKILGVRPHEPRPQQYSNEGTMEIPMTIYLFNDEILSFDRGDSAWFDSQIKTILFTHMRKKIEITYWWDTNEYPNLTSEQKDALENAAEDRITEMRQDGYREGELIYEDDEISVSGWWESTKKDDE